jgi:hypothetical protein
VSVRLALEGERLIVPESIVVPVLVTFMNGVPMPMETVPLSVMSAAPPIVPPTITIGLVNVRAVPSVWSMPVVPEVKLPSQKLPEPSAELLPQRASRPRA